jgi:hypothetical protein
VGFHHAGRDGPRALVEGVEAISEDTFDPLARQAAGPQEGGRISVDGDDGRFDADRAWPGVEDDRDPVA